MPCVLRVIVNIKIIYFRCLILTMTHYNLNKWLPFLSDFITIISIIIIHIKK